MQPLFAATYVHVFVVWNFTRLERVFFNSIWWGPLSSNVLTIYAVYWSLGRRGYFGVSNVGLVNFVGQIVYRTANWTILTADWGNHIADSGDWECLTAKWEVLTADSNDWVADLGDCWWSRLRPELNRLPHQSGPPILQSATPSLPSRQCGHPSQRSGSPSWQSSMQSGSRSQQSSL